MWMDCAAGIVSFTFSGNAGCPKSDVLQWLLASHMVICSRQHTTSLLCYIPYSSSYQLGFVL